MKRLIRTLLAGALILAMVAVSGAPASAAQGGTDRPFKATANGTLVNEDPLAGECDTTGFPIIMCDQVLSTDFIGTHVGRSTSTGSGAFTFDFFGQSCTTPTVADGVVFNSVIPVVTVAANGDELYAVTDVTGCSDGIGLVEPTGTYEITGGTGRFEGASGAGVITSSVLGFSISTTWTGTISY